MKASLGPFSINVWRGLVGRNLRASQLSLRHFGPRSVRRLSVNYTSHVVDRDPQE